MMLEDLAAHAHQRILSNGGVTLALDGQEPKQGYAFSPYPELERVLPAHGLTPRHIHQYLTDNEQALSMPGNHLGAWHDQQSGNVFLDVSHVGPAHPDTIAEAKKANQIAVFDLANFNEIPTGLERSRDVTSAYHAAPPEYREQIAQQGLLVNPPNVRHKWRSNPAIYAHPTLPEALQQGRRGEAFGGYDGEDIWEIHPSVPSYPDEYSRGVAIGQDVPPSQLRLVHQASAWDWDVAEDQFQWPQKFRSEDPEGMQRAIASGYVVKPHIAPIEPPELDWEHFGAVHPDWLNEWIKKNGPYVVHQTSQGVLHLIHQHGLIPWDAPGMRSLYNNDMRPRPDHVYVRYPDGPMRGYHVHFDLRKLDPERIHADEDPFFDSYSASGARRVEPHLTKPEVIRDDNRHYRHVKDAHGTYGSFGEWAEHHRLNEPAHVAHSLNEAGTLAIKGGIDPEAIVSPEEVKQWHEANGTLTDYGFSGGNKIANHVPVPYNYSHTPVVKPLVSADQRAEQQAIADWQSGTDIEPMDTEFEPAWPSKLPMFSNSHIYTREGSGLKSPNTLDGKVSAYPESLGPQSLEEFDMVAPKPVTSKQCPHCQWFGRFADVCPRCGFDVQNNVLPAHRPVTPQDWGLPEGWGSPKPQQEQAWQWTGAKTAIKDLTHPSMQPVVPCYCGGWDNNCPECGGTGKMRPDLRQVMVPETLPWTHKRLIPQSDMRSVELAKIDQQIDMWRRIGWKSDKDRQAYRQLVDRRETLRHGSEDRQDRQDQRVVNEWVTDQWENEGGSWDKSKPALLPGDSDTGDEGSKSSPGKSDSSIGSITLPTPQDRPLPQAHTHEGASPLTELRQSLGLGNDSELCNVSSVTRTQAVHTAQSLIGNADDVFSENRPSFRELPTYWGIREGSKKSTDQSNNFSNIQPWNLDWDSFDSAALASSWTPIDRWDDSTESIDRNGYPNNSYYHVAPSRIRDSIQQHGLDYTKGASPWEHEYELGNYLYSDPELVHGYGQTAYPEEPYDVWQVNPDGVAELQADPEVTGDPHRHFTPHPVAPTHLRLLHQDRRLGSHTDGTKMAGPMESPARFDWETPYTHYHVAPTSERARIMQHGLQASSPLNSGNWNNVKYMVEGQPTGVYLWNNSVDATDYRDQFGKRTRAPMDIWGVHHHGPLSSDEEIYGAQISHDPIHPSNMGLVSGPEHQGEEWDRENWSLPPHLMLWPETQALRENENNKNPWGLGFPNRVIGSSPDGTDLFKTHAAYKAEAPAGDYYHFAPTTERARILQHGLQPARPYQSDNLWKGWNVIQKQPEGVYVSQDPSSFAANNWNVPVDMWRIPAEQIQKLYKDRHVPGAFRIKHPVQAELHLPFENSEKADKYWESQNSVISFRSPDGIKTAGPEHRLWWKPGQFGRGLISPEGIVHTWPEEEMTHAQRLMALGINHADTRDWKRFSINPNRTTGTFGDPEEISLLESVGLKPSISPYVYNPVTKKAEPNPNYNKSGSHIDGTKLAGPNLPKTYNHNTCPKCGARWPSDPDGETACPKCGYDIPWDGYEVMEGQHNPFNWAVEQDWSWPPMNHFEDDWGPRRFGSEEMEEPTEIPQAIPNPNKFFTSEAQHERRKKNWIEWLWKRSAADPDWINDWIANQGPYMYHGTTQKAIPKITSEGLFPHDHLGTGESVWKCPNCDYTQDQAPESWEVDNTGEMACPKCGDDFLKEQPTYSNSEYAGGYWEPRQGHVYLGTKRYSENYAMKGDGGLVRVDLRKLDPNLMSADEDHWHPNNPNFNHHHPAVSSVYEENPAPSNEDYGEHGEGLGAWADNIRLGQEPQETHYSMGMGSMAYNGHIPAEAIEHVSPYNHEPYSYDAEGKPFVAISGTWENEFSKLGKETPGQIARRWGQLLDEYPDNSKVLHTTPEGYTIRHLPTFGDISRTGLHMRNCWQGLSTYSDQSREVDPWHAHQRYTLNDEKGHPQVAFFVKHPEYNGEPHKISEPLGPRNGAPKPHYEQALRDWAANQGYQYHEADYTNPFLERNYGKTAKETGNQEKLRWESLNVHHPNTASVDHQFPNGWTVQQLRTRHDVNRVGKFMKNCWQGKTVLNPKKLDDASSFWTLNDERGLPRVAFKNNVYAPEFGRDSLPDYPFMKYNPLDKGNPTKYPAIEIDQALGMRNQRLNAGHADLFRQWAAAKGIPIHFSWGGGSTHFDHPQIQDAYFSGKGHIFDGGTPVQGILGEPVPA